MPFLLRRVGLENRERKCEVTNENMWKYVKEFAMEEDAVGVVEIILILVENRTILWYMCIECIA